MQLAGKRQMSFWRSTRALLSARFTRKTAMARSHPRRTDGPPRTEQPASNRLGPNERAKIASGRRAASVSVGVHGGAAGPRTAVERVMERQGAKFQCNQRFGYDPPWHLCKSGYGCEEVSHS
jgi:hypothetical protein